MANQTGIAITITAFLPTGKTLDEQFDALSIVKTAHATGDYAALLKASRDVQVKTEQKTRRIPDAPLNPAPTPEQIAEAEARAKGLNADGTERRETIVETPPEELAPTSRPDLVDDTNDDYARGVAAAEAGQVITGADAENEDFMSGFTVGDKAKAKAAKKKAA